MSVQNYNRQSTLDVEGEYTCLTVHENENIDDDEWLCFYLHREEFFRVFIWSVMLLLGFGLCRLLCIGNGRYEYCRPQSNSDLFDNFTVLFLMGITLSFFTGVHSAVRYNYLYGFSADTKYSGVLFLFTFLLTPVVWKGLDLTSLKSFIFTTVGLSHNTVPLLFCITLFLFTVCWHFYAAYRLGVYRVYVISRCLLFLYFVLNIVVCRNQPDINIHVHHYQLGWFIALLGCFNHPISVITLSFGMGLFVEGLATFGADSMFVPIK